ncbi:MAG: G5 domain-containing protein [Clostridia bacterium]|nr:G5 domain-containing protein [Clostridia bacterium]
MDNRNPPIRRQDSATDKERRSMQQGYPVRADASRSSDIPVNRPEGPVEVPPSMRQGKIPVRKNAATGRTIPVMNRSGQPIPQVPTEMPETDHTPVSDAELLRFTVFAEVPADEPAAEETENTAAPDTEDILHTETVPQEPETAEESADGAPETAEPADADIASDEAAETDALPEETTEIGAIPVETDSTSEETADAGVISEETTEIDTIPGEASDADEISSEADDADSTPEEAADTGIAEKTEAVTDTEQAESIPEVSPAPEKDLQESEQVEETVPVDTADKEETEEEHDPDEDLLLILHRRRQAQTEEPPVSSPAEEQPAETLTETTEEAETADSPAAETEETGGRRKIWILPLAAAVLVSLAMLIGIPAFFTPAETAPDFDMTLSYGETMPGPETGIPDETGGAGREDPPTADSNPPETTPQAVKFNVTLDFFDRDPLTVSTSEITLEALLERVNYVVLETDRFAVDLSTLLTEEITIAVDTVTYGTATETLVIPHETQTTNVQTIPRGQRNVTQFGQDGSKTITYTTEIVNGVEVSRTVAKEEITKQPVTETCQVGIGGTLVGNDGKTYSYSYYRMVNATYYDIEGLTYLGYEADESVVAVDMDYIPLGTKIYVKNDQFDFGVRVAADTGSLIEGWEVDIWLDDSNPQKKDFAYIGYVKNMIIYYLD